MSSRRGSPQGRGPEGAHPPGHAKGWQHDTGTANAGQTSIPDGAGTASAGQTADVAGSGTARGRRAQILDGSGKVELTRDESCVWRTGNGATSVLTIRNDGKRNELTCVVSGAPPEVTATGPGLRSGPLTAKYSLRSRPSLACSRRATSSCPAACCRSVTATSPSIPPVRSRARRRSATSSPAHPRAARRSKQNAPIRPTVPSPRARGEGTVGGTTAFCLAARSRRHPPQLRHARATQGGLRGRHEPVRVGRQPRSTGRRWDAAARPQRLAAPVTRTRLPRRPVFSRRVYSFRTTNNYEVEQCASKPSWRSLSPFCFQRRVGPQETFLRPR